MILYDGKILMSKKSCPHTRGDDPFGKIHYHVADTLVPIRVGMIPTASVPIFTSAACPHTRGDDPHNEWQLILFYVLSPYAWG